MMSEQISTQSSRPAPSRRGVGYEVRTVWLRPDFKPYGWEIVNEITGEAIKQSTERFRKPAEAWAAGVAERTRLDLNPA
jgi:hypothetical protein